MTDFSAVAASYIAAWNTTDPDARRRAVQELFAADVRYVDPLVVVDGPRAVDEMIAAVQAQFPGHVFRLAGPVDAHHEQARFGWELVARNAPDEVAPVVGFDVVQVDPSGRLRTVLGFLDRVPA